MGKTVDYATTILETAEELRRLEKQQPHARFRDRIRFLRLLKEGTHSSQAKAGAAVGLGIRQAQRYWQRYSTQGIDALLTPPTHTNRCRLGIAEQNVVKERLKEGQIQTLGEAVAMIEQEFGVRYTEPAVHYLFKRLKIKKKTGRPLNIRQEGEEREDFKKNTSR